MMCGVRYRVADHLRVIAVVGVLLGAGVGWARLLNLSEEHRKKAKMYSSLEDIVRLTEATCRSAENDPDPLYRQRHSKEWHDRAELAALQREYYRLMKEKYLRAADRPWESVLPDPPEPPEQPEINILEHLK
jgi:hypothetical protein